MVARLRQHLHFFVVIAVLAAVMTFPTIVYVFRTDVRWLPETKNVDVFIKLWDIWYGKQVLTGQADRFRTELIYFPEGVPLAYHSLSFPFFLTANALQAVMPVYNAFNLVFLLSIISSAVAAYYYLYWLLRDKWLALFGAVIFAFTPQTVGFSAWPELAWIAPMPLVFYCAHRGIKEKRRSLIILAGLLAGLTTAVVSYLFVSVLIALGLLWCGLGLSRWRDGWFWRQSVLLIALIALTCSWRVIPLIQHRDAQVLLSIAESEDRSVGDAVSFIINRENPFIDHAVSDILGTPDDANIIKKAYLGLLPLALIGLGLVNKGARRKMAPWLGLISVFLVLSLSETLSVNGVVYESVKLPKYYLNQWLPFVFNAFYRSYLFMAGAWLPLAILACLGLKALLQRLPGLARPEFILLLIIVAAFEKYDPVADPPHANWTIHINDERLAYINWLTREEPQPTALVNLPFGFYNAHFYTFAQTLTGYPISEGAISRVPAGALDYVKGNYILSAWHAQRPLHCDAADRDKYLAALAALESVGFSHIVLHHILFDAETVAKSFTGIQAAYSDGIVSVYRLDDLRQSCPVELEARHGFAAAYSDALVASDSLREEPGVIVVLPPTFEIAQHFMRYLEQNPGPEQTVVVYSDNQGKVQTKVPDAVELNALHAVWLLQAPVDAGANIPGAARDWLSARFKYCARVHETSGASVDLYLKLGLPCSAMDERSAADIIYDGGARLRNASFEVTSEAIRFYLAWRGDSDKLLSYSIQFFDADGANVFQYDQVIVPRLLDVPEFDRGSIPHGAYAVKLVVYDYETRASRGGAFSDGRERFDRVFELATLEL